MVSLLGLATAVPPHRLDQSAVIGIAGRKFAKSLARYPKLADVFVNAGIDRRYSARPLRWFEEPHDWSERTQAYLDGAGDLFVKAAKLALKRARIAARVPIFGLGCAGGVSGLATAAKLARAKPGDTVLLVVVELCTLSFRGDRGTKADVISTALFGDGAAAAVLRAGKTKSKLRIGMAAEHTWPDTLDIMGWSVDPIGFGVVLSRSLPAFVEQRLAAPARRFMKAAKLKNPRFICHPGGAKVLDAVETALELKSGTLADEREVLRRYGNMSAPTVLFVLERALRRGLKGPAVLSALGPGFTASFLAIEGSRG